MGKFWPGSGIPAASVAVLLGGLLLRHTAAFRPFSAYSKALHRGQTGLQHFQRVSFFDTTASVPIDTLQLSRRRSLVLAISVPSNDKDGDATSRNQRSSKLVALRQTARRFARTISVAGAVVMGAYYTLRPQAAQASAPIMAMPKAESRDPASEALNELERRKVRQAQDELKEMARQANEIEAQQGEKARIKFEKDYKERKAQEAKKREEGLEQLKRDLLDQGISPFNDMEGQRQIVLYEKGLDLAKVSGTPYNLEMIHQSKSPKKSQLVKKEHNRKMIALMVQDMKNRGVDPLDYFAKRQDQTDAILDMPPAAAAQKVEQYRTNLDEYGQITVPKPGEMSAKERMTQEAEQQKNSPEGKRRAKEEAKLQKQEERLRRNEEKLREKEERQRIKAEAKAARQREKDERKGTLAGTAAGAAAGISTVANTAQSAGETVSQSTQSMAEGVFGSNDSGGNNGGRVFAMPSPTESDFALPNPVSGNAGGLNQKVTSSKLPIVPVAAVTLAAGGGAYSLNVYREKQKRNEEERQRRFKMLMGDKVDGSKQSKSQKRATIADETDEDDLMNGAKEKNESPAAKIVEPEAADAGATGVSKTRRLGLKNVFSKGKNSRETDLNNLVLSDAEAPELASLLAKLLTFGAPGRFLSVDKLPGGIPMETFEQEEAKSMLQQAQEKSGLSLDESAEVFASVVNCMLIDIVDLASSSLKEKDGQATVNAIGIVVDFMNHAASLYDAVAGDATIKPVTYGGSLSKSKLEQMYSAYAVSGMLNMDKVGDDFEQRVALLQDVFQINDKKAEGLMMKAVQKNMMEYLKNGGEGMPGMEDMMKSMGGMGGLMGGDGGEEPSPEQLKEMLQALKQMKDSGSIPPDELENVKSQFKEAFGSSIDDVMKGADSEEEMTESDKELLQLMKSILD